MNYCRFKTFLISKFKCRWSRRKKQSLLTLKKSSWCTTQQLGNVLSSLFVKVVFPPLVTLKWNVARYLTRAASFQIHNVNTLNETYPPMPMMNFILTCVWIGRLRNSVNKRREPSQSKQSLRGFLWKPFPLSSATTDVPPLYYFIDRQSLRPAYKGFSCSVTALSDQSAPPPSAANQPLLNRAHHQSKEGGLQSQKLPLAVGVGGGQWKLAKWMHRKRNSKHRMENNRLRKCWTEIQNSVQYKRVLLCCWCEKLFLLCIFTSKSSKS